MTKLIRKGTTEEQLQDVTPGMMLKLLSRNSDFPEMPERKLWLAVLGQALVDNDVVFFRSACGKVAEVAGLNPAFVRELVLPWAIARDKDRRKMISPCISNT